jgi:hypothetical protein
MEVEVTAAILDVRVIDATVLRMDTFDR